MITVFAASSISGALAGTATCRAPAGNAARAFRWRRNTSRRSPYLTSRHTGHDRTAHAARTVSATASAADATTAAATDTTTANMNASPATAAAPARAPPSGGQ